MTTADPWQAAIDQMRDQPCQPAQVLPICGTCQHAVPGTEDGFAILICGWLSLASTTDSMVRVARVGSCRKWRPA